MSIYLYKNGPYRTIVIERIKIPRFEFRRAIGIFIWLFVFCRYIHSMWKIDFFHKVGHISETRPGGRNEQVTQNNPGEPLQGVINS